MLDIGNEIKRLRSDFELTQDEFAKKIGVHGRQLARYESGTNTPSIDVIKRIAEFCEVSIDRLVYGKDDFLSKKLKVSDQNLLQLFRKIDKMNRTKRQQFLWILSSLISKK